MATRLFTRSLITTTKQSLVSFHRLRPLSAAVANNLPKALSSGTGDVRGFSTRRTSSSLNDPNPNWSNRPPKETILLDGCDFEHWLVVMEKPEGDPTRDDLIDSYIKTLAQVIGSEEEARMKIYSVSTRHYYAFGALVSEELSYKLKELDKVRWVLPDSYLHVREKDYGGEPFINGQAVPYDPKYHEEWVRNSENVNRRKDRPYRRRDMPTTNRGHSSNTPPQNNISGPSDGSTSAPQNSMSGPPNMHGGMPQNNMYGPPNNGNISNNNSSSSTPNYMSGPPNMHGGMPQNNRFGPPNNGNSNSPMPPNNFSRPPPPDMRGGGMQGNNMSQPPSNYNRGVVPPPGGGPNNAPTFQHGVPVPPYQGQQQSNYAPNPPPPPHAGYPYQNQNLPGRDMPPN